MKMVLAVVVVVEQMNLLKVFVEIVFVVVEQLDFDEHWNDADVVEYHLIYVFVELGLVDVVLLLMVGLLGAEIG